MIFRICLYLFLFFQLTGSRLYVGNLMTVRLFLTLVLFVLTLIEERRFISDKVIFLYALFVSVFGLSSAVTGFFDQFCVSVLTYYFAAFVGWRAIVVYLRKCKIENKDGTQNLILFIIIIGALDVAITYSQFINNREWYLPLERFFQFPTAEYYEDALDYQGEQGIMSVFLPGLFGNAIINGYYLSLCSVLSLFFVVKYRKVFLFIIPSLFLFGTFICQERAPLFLAIAAISYILFKINSFFPDGKRLLIFLFVIIAFLGGLYLYSFSEINELRYSSLRFDDGGRNEVYKRVFDYLRDEPFLPNIYESIKVLGFAPHNLFLNAYVYGGAIAFLSIMAILFIQAKQALKIVSAKMTDYNYLVVLVGVSWFIFTLNGLVHNRSIVTGELLPWVLWAIIQTNYSFLKEDSLV